MTLGSADALALWQAKALPLTETDASVFNRTVTKGGDRFKAGDKVSLSDMVRYPTLARKLETTLEEIQAEQAGQRELLEAILAAVRPPAP